MRKINFKRSESLVIYPAIRGRESEKDRTAELLRELNYWMPGKKCNQASRYIHVPILLFARAEKFSFDACVVGLQQ